MSDCWHLRRIKNTTTAILTIDNIGDTDAGTDYNVVVSNDCGNATSGNAALVLNAPQDCGTGGSGSQTPPPSNPGCGAGGGCGAGTIALLPMTLVGLRRVRQSQRSRRTGR